MIPKLTKNEFSTWTYNKYPRPTAYQVTGSIYQWYADVEEKMLFQPVLKKQSFETTLKDNSGFTEF